MTAAPPRHSHDNPAEERDDERRPAHTAAAVIGTIAIALFAIVPLLLCFDDAIADLHIRPTWYMYLLTAGGVLVMVAALAWVGIDIIHRVKQVLTGLRQVIAALIDLRKENRALRVELAELRRQQHATTAELIACLRNGFAELGLAFNADKVEHGNQRWYLGYAARDKELLADGGTGDLLQFPTKSTRFNQAPPEGSSPTQGRSRGHDAPAR